MTRRLLNLVTAVSLLLCAAVAAFWVRSSTHFDWAARNVAEDGGWAAHSVYSWRGEAGYVRSWGRSPRPRAGSYRLARSEPDDPAERNRQRAVAFEIHQARGFWAEATPVFSRLGFSAHRGAGRPVRLQRAVVPYWSLLALTLLVPVSRAPFVIRRARAKRRAARCAACGHDLAGNAGGVCPRCATPGH